MYLLRCSLWAILVTLECTFRWYFDYDGAFDYILMSFYGVYVRFGVGGAFCVSEVVKSRLSQFHCDVVHLIDHLDGF